MQLAAKRYKAALLNNWVFDIKRNKKVALNITSSPNVSSQNKESIQQISRFFFSERSQYAIDYDTSTDESSDKRQSSDRLIIYFFNVRRGNVFKNYLLKRISEDLFTCEEIRYE